MALDKAWLFLQVVGWSQTITHGEKWPYRFRVIARTSDDEEFAFGTGGYRRLCKMPVHLTLVREQPEGPMDGIGALFYFPGTAAHDDIDGMDESVSGWFWLPEALYDEIWAQAREHRYDECVVELEIGPVGSTGPAARWNTGKNKIVSIMRAGVRFERKPNSSAAKKAKDEPKSQIVELPARPYWMLAVLAAISAALLVWAFLRD